jgi:DNA-binding CsgD family transcriptional regulator
MGDLSYLKDWITARTFPGAPDGQPAMVREFEQFFAYIFDHSPDGISILDLDFTILGVNTAMERWYAHTGPIVGRKCHEVYHGRSSPCENCPTKVTLATGRPQDAIVPYEEGPEQVRGTQELSVFPLFDDNGRMFCLIEYVREITDLAADRQIVERLKKRIQFQDQTLQEQEAALAVLLRRGDQAARRVANDVLSNIGMSVTPLIARIKERADAGLREDLALLEGRLARVTSPLMRRLSGRHKEFTQREREIAELILEGKSSKEIAEHFCLTVKAVDFHRMNLRRKLNMGSSGQSLQSKLTELVDEAKT